MYEPLLTPYYPKRLRDSASICRGPQEKTHEKKGNCLLEECFSCGMNNRMARSEIFHRIVRLLAKLRCKIALLNMFII